MALMFYLSIVLMIWAGFDRGALGSDLLPSDSQVAFSAQYIHDVEPLDFVMLFCYASIII